VRVAPADVREYIVLMFASLFVLAATPTVGSVAPDFTVKDVDGRELALSKLVEKGPVVVAFYPKAFTPG
jgi:thioredoxin-dependent peroxiredoxin